MIFQALGSTVRHLTTSRMTLSLGGKQTVYPTLPFCLPIYLFYKELTLVVLYCETIKWCAYSASVALGLSFPSPFFPLYVCSHYILYYFFLTLLSLYLIWLPCDIKLVQHISLNILPPATCLVFFLLFSSALSISNSLLQLYLSLIFSSSSVFSVLIPFIFFLHGESSSFPPVTLLSSLFALLLSFTSLSPVTFSPA